MHLTTRRISVTLISGLQSAPREALSLPDMSSGRSSSYKSQATRRQRLSTALPYISARPVLQSMLLYMRSFFASVETHVCQVFRGHPFDASGGDEDTTRFATRLRDRAHDRLRAPRPRRRRRGALRWLPAHPVQVRTSSLAPATSLVPGAQVTQANPIRDWTVHGERVLPRAGVPQHVGGDEAHALRACKVRDLARKRDHRRFCCCHPQPGTSCLRPCVPPCMPSIYRGSTPLTSRGVPCSLQTRCCRRSTRAMGPRARCRTA